MQMNEIALSRRRSGPPPRSETWEATKFVHFHPQYAAPSIAQQTRAKTTSNSWAKRPITTRPATHTPPRTRERPFTRGRTNTATITPSIALATNTSALYGIRIAVSSHGFSVRRQSKGMQIDKMAVVAGDRGEAARRTGHRNRRQPKKRIAPAKAYERHMTTTCGIHPLDRSPNEGTKQTTSISSLTVVHSSSNTGLVPMKSAAHHANRKRRAVT